MAEIACKSSKCVWGVLFQMHGTLFAAYMVRCGSKALLELAEGDLCDSFVSHLIISSMILETAETFTAPYSVSVNHTKYLT